MPQQKPREGRRHGIPPAPQPRRQFDVLTNLEGALGLVLWRAVRDVLLWAEAAPESRATLFEPMTQDVRDRYAVARTEAPELSGALGTFALMQSAPSVADPAHVASACHQVYRWADKRSLMGVAVHFAEAAALAEPDRAAWAVDAGWICRRANEGDMLARSAAWYQRAFSLAVRTKHRRDSIRSLTGYGALMKDLGDVEEARTAYLRAARRAARTGRKRHAAVAHHYLFALAAESGTFAEALEHAGRALTLYPLHDVRVPALAHDWAFLLVRNHVHRHGLALLLRTSPLMEQPAELLLVFSTTARAAGGARRPERFGNAERAVLEMVGLYPEYAAASFVNLAEGARALGEWGRAEAYLRTALDVARQRKDAEPERVARELLQAVERRETPPPATGPDDETAALTRRFAARLTRWRNRSGRSPGSG
ncbi:MAG TPA: hypothetical protein VFS20_18555 [Longimicrobium sp.]|nr:hypothetical protein [Longimicrobium sp.]